MFERTKSYDQGMKAMHSWLSIEAFQHCGNKTHEVFQVLQESCQKITEKIGKWNLWWTPIRGTERAQFTKKRNVPAVKKEVMDMDVDEDQFIKRRGLARVSESEDEKFED